MCQAIPRLILRTDEAGRVEVDYDGEPTWVEARHLGQLTPGQYLIVYAGQALECMDKAEAEDMLAFYAGLEQMLEEAHQA